ncbi:hypothetical protein Mth01_47940 [Sphaerimonospora thailandensis]|uniref:Uncharacterized protein n=1 Tax=Sphaerimonospora thailandensis TaxID=795644 RepID=A0A8J3W289_9ACTN|nr:hypothetical protein Mth01_47940 [Sphaerimonospora thailandensis]
MLGRPSEDQFMGLGGHEADLLWLSAPPTAEPSGRILAGRRVMPAAYVRSAVLCVPPEASTAPGLTVMPHVYQAATTLLKIKGSIVGHDGAGQVVVKPHGHGESW